MDGTPVVWSSAFPTPALANKSQEKKRALLADRTVRTEKEIVDMLTRELLITRQVVDKQSGKTWQADLGENLSHRMASVSLGATGK